MSGNAGPSTTVSLALTTAGVNPPSGVSLRSPWQPDRTTAELKAMPAVTDRRRDGSKRENTLQR